MKITYDVSELSREFAELIVKHIDYDAWKEFEDEEFDYIASMLEEFFDQGLMTGEAE